MHTTTPNIVSNKPLFKPTSGKGMGFVSSKPGGIGGGLSSSAQKPSMFSSSKPAFMVKKKQFVMAAPVE